MKMILRTALVIAIAASVARSGACLGQETTEPPIPLVQAAGGWLSIDSAVALGTTLKANTIVNTGYGWQLNGTHNLLMEEQLTLATVNVKKFHAPFGFGHATLFGDVNRQFIGLSLSPWYGNTPVGLANVLDSIKPIAPSFQRIYAFGFFGPPPEDVINAHFAIGRCMVGAGLGVSF